MGKWVCIDFGTCNSAAAIIVDHSPTLVCPNNRSFFPTVACVIGKDEIAVCHSAEQFRAKYPEFYLQEFKLDIDKPLDCNGADYPKIIAAILGYIKSCAETENNGESIENVLLTVPAIYTGNDRRLDVMKEAAAMAGFRGIEFMTEPNAAALHFAWIQGKGSGNISVIYDLGGGTFDTTLIKTDSNGHSEILGYDSGIKCGGQYFDAAIYKAASKIAGNSGKPLSRDCRWNDFSACRMLKEDLSAKTSASTLLSNGESFTLSRSEFEEMIKNRLRLTIDACDNMLSVSKKQWSDIDNILLVGGSTSIPLVSELLKNHLISHNAQNVKIIRNHAGTNGKYDHNYAVCLGGITVKDFKEKNSGCTGKLLCIGKEFPLHSGTNTFGRGQDQDFIFDDAKMSRAHFIIDAEDDNGKGWIYKLTTVSNTKSTTINHTLALDKNVTFAPQSIELENGMTIVAGQTEFTFTDNN